MAYNSIDDLPENVRGVLPPHAQKIYKEAFNSAWRQYSEPYQRKGENDRETTARKVAWSAVETSYEKRADGSWRKKDSGK